MLSHVLFIRSEMRCFPCYSLRLPFLRLNLIFKCLSDMENDLRDRRTCSKQDLAKQTTIASAKQKVASHIYDSFYRDEITHMVFALDSLTRKYREQLTENIPPAQAEAVGAELRTAAIVLSKLKRANPQN